MKNFTNIFAVAIIAALAMPTLNSCKKGEEDPFLSLKTRKARVAGEWTLSTYEITSDMTTTYEDLNTSIPGNTIKDATTSKISFDGTNVTENTTITETKDNADYSEAKIKASGTSFTEDITIKSNGVTTSPSQVKGVYSHTVTTTYTFDKDGSFKMTTTKNRKTEFVNTTEPTLYNPNPHPNTNSAFDNTNSVSNNETTTVEGTWAFIGKDKKNEYANKERIGIWYSSNTINKEVETKKTFTDKDLTDNMTAADYEKMNTTTKTTDNNSSTDKNTNPNQIWELVELKSKEMKVIFNGTSTNKNGTSTNSTTAYSNTSFVTTSTTTKTTNTITTTGSMTLTAK